MKKLFKLSIALIIIVIFTYYFYAFFQQLPKATYKFRSEPKLLTSEVKPGEYVRWQNDICKLHDKEFRTERILKNLDTKREFELEATVNRPPGNLPTLKKGECRVNEVAQLIPEDTLPGKYEITTNVYVKSTRRSIDKFDYSVGPFIIK